MKRNAIAAWMGAIALGACLLVSGCAQGGDGLSKEQKEAGDRVDQIVKKTGGDWSKLSPEDKDYLVNKLSNGNEGAAKMMLNARTGRPPMGGGPPTGGK